MPQSYATTARNGVVYSSLGGSPLRLDAYLPAASGASTPPTLVPAVILVHGGGFVAGGRSGLDGVAGVLARAGLAAFSVDYTLASAQQVGFPLQVKQVLAAVAYVRQNAAAFHVDPNHIGTFGTSAGATLAVLAAVVAPSWQPGAAVQADVGWSGPYDFTAYTNGTAKTDVPTQTTTGLEFLGCSSLNDPTCPAKARDASAVDHVTAGSPPTLLATSDDFKAGCEIVDPSQSSEMGSTLRNAGVLVRLDVNHSCAHALNYWPTELAPTLLFLQAQL